MVPGAKACASPSGMKNSRRLAQRASALQSAGMNSIELLEPRIAPAILTPVVTKGTLTITHDTNSATTEKLVLTQTGPDSFTLNDTLAAVGFGPFSGVKNVAITLGEAGPTADLRFSNDGLPGNLTINTGNGGSDIGIRTVNGSAGRIAGAVKIIGGNFADKVLVEDGLAITKPVVFDGHDGSDEFRARDAYLAKKLTLESVETITIEDISPVVIGGMLVENEEANAAVVFVLSNVSTIAGPLTYCGSDTVTDTVTLDGQVIGPALLMLFGGVNDVSSAGNFSSSLKITGAGGTDSVLFRTKSLNLGDPLEGPFITAKVAGPLAIKLGDGANDVTFTDGSVFAKGFSIVGGKDADTINFAKFNADKNVSLNLGSGANTLTDLGGGLGANFISGSFSYTGGGDADTVNLDGLIAGKIKIILGNGTNGVDGIARIIGASAGITGGTGADTVSLTLHSTAGALTAKLGDGADAFTFNGGALASVKLDGGKGTDTLTGLANLPVKRTISGFE